jgi:hypothetical protein
MQTTLHRHMKQSTAKKKRWITIKSAARKWPIEKKYQSFHALDRFGSDDYRLQSKLSYW